MSVRACNAIWRGHSGGGARLWRACPFSQFHKGLPMCGGKWGSGTLHKTSAAAGPSSDGGLWPCGLFWVQSHPDLNNKKDGHFSRSARFVEIAPSARSPPPEFFERRRGSFSASHPPTLGRLDRAQAQQQQLAAWARCSWPLRPSCPSEHAMRHGAG